MNFYKSRYTGAQIDSLLDKVKEDLASPATLTNKVGANTTAIEQEVTDREKAVSDLNSALTAELDKKVSKVPGKGLSTNDYTNDDKAEVTKIKDKADQTDLNETNSNIRDINTAIEKLVPKEDINTGTFDPTSDNPAGQKSIAGAIANAIDTAFDETSTNAVQNKVIAKFANEVVENKANVDGNYPTMTVGNADLANNLIATKGLEVESYFTFEKTGGEQASAIETGNGTLKNLYGKTLVWKQLLQNGNFGDTSWWYGSGATFSISNNVATFTATELYGGLQHSIQLQAHKYLLGCSLKSSVATDKIRLLMTDGQRNYSVPTQSNTKEQSLFVLADVSNAPSSGYIKIQDNRTSDWTSVDVKNVILIDLTQMFGVGNEPTSIDDYRAQWTISYAQLHLEYNSGQIVHTHITGLKSTGINLWDEEWRNGFYDISTGAFVSYSGFIANKNQIRVKPSTTYYFECQSSYVDTYVYEYDINGNFIGRRAVVINSTFTTQANTEYINFIAQATTYNHDICINFSNPNINGNYYSYEEETLNIDFDGNGVGTAHDEINVKEGKKYQRLGVVDLGTCDWSIASNKWYTNSIRNFSIGNLNLLCSKYEKASNWSDSEIELRIYQNSNGLYIKDSTYTSASDFKSAMSGVLLVYELAEPIVTDIEIPKDTIKVWNGGSMEALGTEVPVGTKIFYQKNIKNFIEGLGEATSWDVSQVASKSDVYTKDQTDTLLASKQDALVSGENIKTLNGISLLGSGDYAFDTALNENSTNAVQNKVIAKFANEVVENKADKSEVSEVVTDITNIKNGTTHLFENITDSAGNKRFVDGDFSVKNIEGITWIYHKWSLSGTHLMIVIAGKNDSGSDITFKGNEVFGELQVNNLSYIYNKISTLTAYDLVSTAPLRTYLDYKETEKGNLSLTKPNTNHIRIINWNRAVTDIPAGAAFRVQFDLLIDAS